MGHDDGRALLDEIVRQHRISRLLTDDRKAATRRLAVLAAQVQAHPSATLSQAAKAMGVHRSYLSTLVRRLDAGELDR